MSVLSEKRFYDAANAYYQGAIILMYDKERTEASDRPLDLTHPAVHCAASALKLYLKCLLAFKGKSDDNLVDHLSDLYQNLSNETRSLIMEKFGEFSGYASSSAEFITYFSGLDNSLANWRHVLGEETTIDIDRLKEMILATRAAIAGFKPDWE